MISLAGFGAAPQKKVCFLFCPHILNMEERERVRIGGVMEVLSFDEDGIMMETTCGLLLLKGAGMHIGKLDLEAGDVVVDGSIDSMTYSDGTLAEKHSILGRLFR